ncbi:autotransporter strand-loop-strand O-heptosyltransferase, partial [Phascolarctobacterium sp.]
KTRRIKEPYVCIAAQASSQAKYWNNGRGWLNVVRHLKELGYRVLCIDRENNYGMGSRYNIIPYGAEDFTGRRPLQERIDLLYHADFFVGLSSGLSWVANGVGIPVVLISGFTLPINEFATPYRVISYHVCNGCWNDTRVVFDHKDFEWCPRHKGTDRQFECSRYITPEAVNKVIDRLMADYKLKPQKQAVNKKKIKGEQ